MHKIGDLLGRWEAFILEFEVVVEESLVILETVLLALEELVYFYEP